ncbi:MAG: class I SAM-dependent methyltransferase [Methanomicrobiaceae archaeon]|uniref:Methyltransferase n=1 Tax=hydrocarbon metagenome TaxID=938273 RepID=A0A0W8FHS2_9ZZZZ|nr:class I SAM-dependent methyltransferase [Methanomicrobiaceae archaeon]MDD5420141.1 class I SAM-dependent methyltransferase [Methanomicrobiaceae archaeon]
MKQIDLDAIYRSMDPEAIPWNIAEPPDALVDLVESGAVAACRAIDLGCGIGNHAVYLASRGFEMTGVDISPSAIRAARKNAEERGVACNFLVADVLTEPGWLRRTFDFAYDWELLHHIMPEDRERYVAHVHAVLNDAGKYLSICFSESDPQFGGRGKYRKTSIGTVLYFSSEDELEDLFAPLFDIIELKTIEISGRSAPHRAVYAFMEKR